MSTSGCPGDRVAATLTKVSAERGLPRSTTVDRGTEFASKPLDEWGDQDGVLIDFARPGVWRK